MMIPGRMLRHIAKYNNNLSSQLIVVLKQLAEAPQYALIIDIDTIKRNVDRDEVIALVQRSEGQGEEDFINALHKANMLQQFHNNGYFKKVLITDIVLTPKENQAIQLRDVVNDINGKKGLPKVPAAEEIAAVNDQPANPRVQDKMNELQNDESRVGIAKSLIFQANLMQQEVNKKLNEAYDMCPQLRPSAKQTVKEAIKSVNDRKVLAVEELDDATIDAIKKAKVKKTKHPRVLKKEQKQKKA